MPNSRLARRSRSAVLWGLAAVVGLQLGLAVAVERWRAEVRDPEYAHRLSRLRARLAKERSRPLLLVLGSSRTANGFRPDVLTLDGPAGEAPPVVFNFGITGNGPAQELMYLHRLLKDGIRPRWLLVEVLPSQLLQPSTDASTAVERLAWSDLAVLNGYLADPAGFRQRWWQSRLQPWSSYRFYFLNEYAARWLPISNWRFRWWKLLDEGGWARYPRAEVTSWEKRAWVEDSRLHFARLLQTESVPDAPARALADLVELCRREGIEPLLFLMPESSAFRSWYSAQTWQVLDELLNRLRGSHGVPIIDARAWVEDDGFYDSQHLLPRGAARFSERLGHEVLQPLVQGRTATRFR